MVVVLGSEGRTIHFFSLPHGLLVPTLRKPEVTKVRHRPGLPKAPFPTAYCRRENVCHLGIRTVKEKTELDVLFEPWLSYNTLDLATAKLQEPQLSGLRDSGSSLTQKSFRGPHTWHVRICLRNKTPAKDTVLCGAQSTSCNQLAI